MNYQDFLSSKSTIFKAKGLNGPFNIHPMLFPFQRDIVTWALKRGRACLWEDCGLGKTLQQIAWAANIPGDVLILCPLAVAHQTVLEGQKIGVEINYRRSGADVTPGITIANYEMLEHFDTDRFTGVVLDESSILKAFMGKTKRMIIERFKATPYKLACTATPAPNDHMELGNHVEFMGLMKSSEMLSKYFINDAAHVGRYRLKGHAESSFWKWVSTWAVMISSPKDLGYADDGFTLPPRETKWYTVNTNSKADGYLFEVPAASLSERISARRNSINERTRFAIDIVKGIKDQVLIWCGLNNESQVLVDGIPDAVEVKGSDSVEHKMESLSGFVNGNIRVLVTKPSIAGYGMNFQSCSKDVWVGLSDSWEDFYQGTRRIWRFGQKNPVTHNIIIASTEGAIAQNIMRKEREAEKMKVALIKEMERFTSKEVMQSDGFKTKYTATSEIQIPHFLTEQNEYATL